MASTYTTSLNLELQASGENSGTWGTKTNTNINLLETAICGGSSSSLAITATTQSLTASDGSADQSRRAVLKLTGTLTGNTTLSSEAVEKLYWVDNQTTMGTYTLTFKPAGGSGVSLASGRKHLIFQDGSTAFDPLADYGPINSSALTVENSTTATPVVTIKNTTNDATGASLRFVMDRGAAGVDADVSGTISFYADDSAQNNQEFAKIVGKAVDASTTSEEGGLDFYVAENDGTVTKGMSITGLSSDSNVDVDISTHDDGTSGLKLGGTLVTSSAAEINLLDGVSGLVQADLTKLAAVDSTYGELNLLDGSAKSTSSITIGDTDAFIVIDGTTTKQIPASDLKTYNPGGTSWQAVKTGAFTASAGQGVFVNTTSSAFTITLPAGSIGDEVSIIDYAGTFDSNNCTIAANGSEKIHGSTDDLTVATERAAFTLVFTDSTQGWLLKDK